MGLDRGTLAKLDRRLLAELDPDAQFQMVRIPVSPVKWSTWKRYCGAAEISMGRAISVIRPSRSIRSLKGCVTTDHVS